MKIVKLSTKEKLRQNALKQWSDPEIRKKMCKAMTGVKRLPLKQAHKDKIAVASKKNAKRNWAKAEYWQKQSDAKTKWWESLSETERAAVIQKMKDNYVPHKSGRPKGCVPWNKDLTMETDDRIISMKGRKAPWNVKKNKSPEMRRKLKEKWQDLDYKARVIEAQKKGQFKRPTSLEQQMIDIIKRNNLPYKYTGDGAFLIGYKNPDFVNCNGEKVCVEVANTFHHDDNYEAERTAHFAKWGWKCIVFRMNELDEKEVLERLGGIA